MVTSANTHQLEDDTWSLAQRLRQQYSWQLLSTQELVHETFRHAAEHATAVSTAAMVRAYTTVLYAACLGQRGESQQRRGFEEVYNAIYADARRRGISDPGDLEDIVQQVVARVAERIHACRHPGSFLAFAFSELKSVLRDTTRSTKRQKALLAAFTQYVPSQRSAWSVYSEPSPEQACLQRETRQELVLAVLAYMSRHPGRASDIQVFLADYILGLTGEEIMTLLGKISMDQVHQLRIRAKQRLRQDASFYQLVSDLGIIIEDEKERGIL